MISFHSLEVGFLRVTGGEAEAGRNESPGSWDQKGPTQAPIASVSDLTNTVSPSAHSTTHAHTDLNLGLL